MSGDSQPRKRKDKKRKKDESTEQTPPPHFTQPVTSTPIPNEDVNIHVHKDEGTGGGICAKIVFFFLFSALIVVIGLLITEHRGLTDLDTVDSESRFAQIFEGWTDDSGHGHDEDDHLDHSLEKELEEEEHEDEDASHEEVEESDHDEEHEAEEQEASDEGTEEQDDDNDDDEEEEEEVEETSDEQRNEDDDEDEDQDQDATEEDDEEEGQMVQSEEEEDGADNSEARSHEEDDNEIVTSEENVDEDDETNEDDDAEDLNVTDSGENDHESQEVDSEVDKRDEDNQEDAETTEKDNDGLDTDEAVPVKLDEPNPEESTSPEKSRMAVKIGVGVALLVVAHVVLVRKWKPAPQEESSKKEDEPIPDLARRNTIVVPPSLEEVRQDLEEFVEEDYSGEDGETESEDDNTEMKSATLRYQELRTTYSRSLTPDNELEHTKKAEHEEDEYEEEEEEDDGEEEDDENPEEELSEDDEELSENEDYDKEYEDEDLLERLEAKYGSLRGEKNPADGKIGDIDDQFSSWKRLDVPDDNEPEESDSDKQSDDYEYENITNKEDLKIKEKIDEAQKKINDNVANAIKLFDLLLQNHPSSPRSLYGKAQALDKQAELTRSNGILQTAISLYKQVLTAENVPDPLFKLAAERCINRMRFAGSYNRAIDVHLMLIDRFPLDPHYRNQLAVSYLTINRVNEARAILQDTLAKHPNNGFALVHYGFILKTNDYKLQESVDYLRAGIATQEQGVIDGRFYFHLGDALARLGKNQEAVEVYEEGLRHKLFLSKYQRSLYNVPRLKGKPFWTPNETPYEDLYAALEKNWKLIRNEGLAVLSKTGYFQNESENLKDTGEWKQFELFARGQKNVKNCEKCPVTCAIIESFPDARGCRRGQTKFSVMHPGTHVWPHCGPTNCRLRVHLGLNVPPDTYIRVADQIRSWENGKILIFDDSFEHEVWHNGTTFRLVLIVDVWHPELTQAEKRSLSPI